MSTVLGIGVKLQPRSWRYEDKLGFSKLSKEKKIINYPPPVLPLSPGNTGPSLLPCDLAPALPGVAMVLRPARWLGGGLLAVYSQLEQEFRPSASAQRSPKPPLEGVSDGARVLSCRAVSGLLCARAAVLGGVSGADPCLGSWKWVQSSLTSVTTRQHWDVCARRCLCVGFESHGQPRSFPSSLLHVIS